METELNGETALNGTSEAKHHLLSRAPDAPPPGFVEENNDKMEKEALDTECEVEIDEEPRKPLIYRVNESPPFHMLVFFALQQGLLVIASPLSLTILVSEIVCGQSDEFLKLQVLSANFLMVGTATFVMSTVGVRLPIFQGTASSYLIPLLAMLNLEEWQCPATFKEIDPSTNMTTLMVTIDNGTTMPAQDLALGRVALLSGSLMAAGVIHSLIGVTGLVGVLCRYIGPITIVPTILLVGLNIFKLVVKFSEPQMGISMVVVACNIFFSLIIGGKKTPIPFWTPSKGFFIFWYPLHQVFSILISLIFGWVLSSILTTSGALSDDPNSLEYLARSDAKNYVIEQTDWFILSYPGKLGAFQFSAGIFVNFLIASILSVLDSIGDYAACAKVVRVTPPPAFAFNRGIAVEGLLSFLSGSLGCCCATVSYGSNIGAIGISRVASRRVFQAVGVLYVVFGVIGKIGAFFISIPYPVLGGTMLFTIGIFIGVLLSYLQTVNMSSTRNVAIIGIAIFLGLTIPSWVERNPTAVNTGYPQLDIILKMLLANPSFIGGIFSCTLDNIAPGTLKDRGLLEQLKDLNDEDAKEMAKLYDDGPEVYRLPWIPEWFRQSRLAKIIPMFEFSDKNAYNIAKNN